MACNYRKEVKLDDIQVKHAAFTSEEDVTEPPPPGFTSNFKTLQEWLFNVCDTEKPLKANLTYNFSLFESPNEYIIALTGVNKYNKDQYRSVTRIEFEPSNMYFTLPNGEHDGLTKTQIYQRLTKKLEDFTKTDKFKRSFFQEAKSITTDWSGEIWRNK